MKRYLVLENGAVFTGEAFGADTNVMAEIVFTTDMVGYVEALTDPCYYGQALCQTFPLGGNYGVCQEDMISNTIEVSALIVREFAPVPSNFRSQMSLDTFLKKHGIPGLSGIDTRALTKMLRDTGTMNGAIVSDPADVNMEELKAYRVSSPTQELSVRDPEIINEMGQYTVAMPDLGAYQKMIDYLVKQDCKIHLLPWDVSADTVLALSPDAICLPEGPGDPRKLQPVMDMLRRLTEKKIPTLGVGLGHQVLALANGFSVENLPYGHRGGQPVRNLLDGQLYITAQNHGYTVKPDSIDEAIAVPYFVNVNDGSIEGLLYQNIPAFSVQFTPADHGGPKDTGYLYAQFMELVRSGKSI